MKRILSFLLFAAFLMPWSAQAQQALPYSYGFEDNDLTVDGWTTSNTSGLNAAKFGIDASAVKTGTYGFRFSSYDDNGVNTQYLISPELVAPNGLVAQFYYKSSSSYGAETFKVGYSTTTTDLESFTWSDEISATGGSWTQSEEFTCPAGTKYVALYYYSNYQYYLYVDDITLSAPPTCIKPATLEATPASTTSATITWAAGNGETAFEYVYALAGEEADWTSPVTVNALTATITGLDQDSDYVFYVRANCGEGDLSAISNVAFHAMRYCTPAPTSVDGSGITAVALGGVEQTEAVHKTNATKPLYADNSTMSFNVPASTVATVDITLATGYTYGTVIWVDWNNNMEFEADEVVYAAQSGSANPTTLNCTFTVPATQAEGTYRMRIGSADSYFDSYISSPTTNTANPCGTGTYCTYEDYSITVTAAPACMQPATPVVSNITTTGADLAWTTEGTQTQFQYVVMASGTEADWTGATLVTSMTATLSGLTANTAYDVYVRAYCGETEQSDAVMVSFRTACDVITTFPWSENFDEVAVGNIEIPCWENEHIVSVSGKTDVFKVAASATGNATHVAQLPDMQSGNITHLTLPAMNIPAANAYEFIITVYRDASGTSYPEEGLRLWSLVGADTVELAFISRNYTQAYTVDETVIVPAEEATGWYTYNFTLPLAGVQNIVVRGESKYGSSTYFDNLVVRQIPNCTKIASLVASDPTADGITLTWVAGNNETQFQYVVMPKDTAVDWTGATIVTGLTATVSNLTDNTPYDAYVRAYCSEEEQGEYRMVSFRTLCGVAPLPYADGFENGIDCWTVGNMQSTSSSYIPSAYSSSTYVHNGSYSLKLNAYDYAGSYSQTHADSAYAVLPVLNYGTEGMTAYRLRFYARNGGTSASYNTHLYVGTLVDREDMSTFTLVQDVEVAGTTHAQYEVSLANYTGEGQYLVLLAVIDQAATATSRYGSFYVDDLMVDLIPNCLRPTDVTVSNITANGAEITCVAGASETAWAVRYKAAADEDWTVATTSTTMPYALTNLAANTAYQVEVAAVCSETETSEWTEPVNFRTACDIEAIPYTENFENGIYCWTVGNMQSESSSYIPSAYNAATYAHDGTYSLRLNAYKTSSTDADSAYAIMPAMNYGVKGLSGHTLKFYARQSSTSTYSSYYNQLMIGVVSDPADMSTFTLVRAEEVTGTTYTFHEVQLGSYAGEGQYIVLLAVTDPTATGTRYGSFYVDDLSVEPTPACQPLASITAVPARTKVEVTLNPKSGLDLSAAYDLVCSATELDNEALEAAQKTVVTESPYTVTGLERETPYYIYVRANCGQEDGVSPWVSTTVTTKGLLGCDDILEIGNGTSTDYGPMCGYYGYERNGYIFTPEDGLTAGNIASIAWEYISTSSIPAKIYLKNTTETGFESTLVWNQLIADATLVFDNTVALTTGWNTIEFNAPFMYTGDNLMVLVASNVGGSGGSTARASITTSENTTCHFYIRKDSSIDDDAAYTSFSSKGMDGKRHNVRFGQCYALDPCPAVTEMTVALEGDGTTAARINWTTADADYLSSYDVLLSTTEVTDFTEVTPTATITDPTATTYVFSNLTAETHYYMYLRANCQAAGHDEGMSDWVGVDTIMNSACAAPNTLTTEFIGLNAVKASWHLAYAEQDMAFRYILSTDELDAAGIAAATPVNVDSNVIEIENLNYEQLYYLYVASACGNSTSEYISTSFTTYAACAPVENLTAARVEHNRVQLTWTKNAFGTETSYEVGLVGVEDSEITVTDNTAMLIGLTPETQYTAYVKAICSETSESAVETVNFTTVSQPGNCNAIGTGTTNSNMPVTNYNYAYTQMIYTADNFDITGNIQSIQLKRSTYANVMNNMKVYIGTTDKNVFASSSDWVPEEDLTLVYQGSFPAGTADAPDLDIPFSTPFAYDGSSNIVIAISNGHGDWHNIQNFYYTSTTATVLTNRSDNSDTYALHPGTAAGQSPQGQRTNIEFCFEQTTCPNVTALAISNVTSNSATATWEPMGSETSWNVYLSTTEVADMSSIVGTPVSAMSYPMSNLLVDQDYWFYVQPACATNTWKVATFRTVATCFPPMGLSARDITSTTAVVCWQDTNAVGDYTVLYGPAATFDIEEPASYETMLAADSSLQLTDLLPYTTYAFVVRCNCDDMSSRYSTAATFKTGAGIPFEPIFETTTLPTDWSCLSGLMSAAVAGTNPTSYSSGWSLIAADTVIDATHFRANIYGTSTKYWVVTPTIDATTINPGEGLLLRVDLGLTAYSASNVSKRNNGVDDQFIIIVQEMTESPIWTMDNATVWSNQEGADYVYNEIPEHGKTYYIDMSKYAGKNIRVAFYGESTVSNADNYFHFGNISLDRAMVDVYTENACQRDGFPKHGFNEASSEEAGAFTFERYTPATETALQQYEVFNLTVNPALNGYIELDVLYVGDHYVDQYVDTIVQLADMAEGYYGFDAGPTALGCDSFWFVTFTEIREATYIHEDSVLAEGESFIWHGQTIEEAGMYYDTVRTDLGGVMAYYELSVTAPAPAGMKAAYVKVTENQEDWAGNYILTFDDMLPHTNISDNGKDFIAAEGAETLVDNNDTILVDSDFADFIRVAATENAYSIQLPAGEYIMIPNQNAVNISLTPADLYISYVSNDDKAGVAIANGADLNNSNTRVIYHNGSYFRGYTNKLTGNLGFILPSLYKYVGLVPDPTPGPVTGMDTIETAEDGAVKVILNGNLYIIRDNQWYDATGRLTVDPRK